MSEPKSPPPVQGPMMPGRMGGPGRGPGGFHGMAPVVKPRQLWPTMARLWSHMRPERPRFLVIFGFLFLGTALTLGLPYVIGKVLDLMSRNLSTDTWPLILTLLALLAGAYLAEAVLVSIQGILIAGVSTRIMRDLRASLFARLHRLPLPFFDGKSHGELMSRLSNDIDLVASTLSQSALQLMSGSILIVGSLTMMLVLSPLLTLAAMVTIPLVLVMTRAIAKRTLPLFKEQQAILGRLNGHIEETVSGMTLVKAFGQETQVTGTFDRLSGDFARVAVRAQIWSGYLMPLMNVLSNLSFAVVASVGGLLAVKQIITVGVIGSFIIYARQFSRPVNEVANLWSTLQGAVAGAERVFEILDEKDEPADPPGAPVLEAAHQDVVFDRVSFRYRPDVPVLTDISFKVPAGSTVAVVGPTGAGKTTLINLLTRFYDVGDGAIRIGAHDIRAWRRADLRAAFGVVLQDSFFFSGTVADNIRYGRPDAGMAEVEQAARTAHADAFIRRLPKGYDTPLAESGSTLSQGERQLLAIARAVLVDPAILILDEATSNVDTRTELHLQEAMVRLMKGRTTLLIAHRLSTIRHADRILVISGGRLTEQGTHDELMALGGIYAEMTNKQVRNLPES